MLNITIDQAKAKMVLARPIYDPDKPSHTLLKPGYKLEYSDIQRLDRLRIGCFWVKYPNLRFLDKLIDPILTRLQQDVCDSLKSQFSSGQEMSLANVNYCEYTKMISAMYCHMVDHKRLSSLFINELYGASEDIFRHSTTVAYLSMLIGMKLESYLIQQRPKLSKRVATDLIPLGVGCLLHDLGKLTLSDDLQGFRLSAQDLGAPAWQKHTEVGFEMVHGGLDSTAAQVVLNHHQHFDGTGFPLRKSAVGSGPADIPLSGTEIHVFCRISTLANMFDNFRQGPDGKEFPSVVALKRLQNPGYLKWFDPVVYSVFCEIVPPFPPGLQVILNDGQICVVKEVNMKKPCRPILCPINLDLAQDAPSESEPPEDICLEKQPALHIAKVGDFDVTNYLY